MTINDVKLLNLRTFIEPDGNLVPVESKHDIPFDIKRIFYVYGVKNQDDRGKHSHYKTKQVLICLSGEVEVICDDGVHRKKYKLTKPHQAIYIPEMIFSHLLTSSNYDKDEKRITGCKNGYGAKLTNIFSKKFVVETLDNTNHKKFVMIFENNMLKKNKPVITNSKGKGYTKITFTPDYEKFYIDKGEEQFSLGFKFKINNYLGVIAEYHDFSSFESYESLNILDDDLGCIYLY